MLPWELLRCIVEFCPLSGRYVFMLTCREFSFVKWSDFGSVYALGDCTRMKLRELFEFGYSNEWRLKLASGVLWNRHLNRPLRVWSPWSTKWFRVGSSSWLITFSKWHFVDYVLMLGNNLQLGTPCIRRDRNCERVVNVWVSDKAKVTSFLVSRDGERHRRRLWPRLFRKKSRRKVRALLGFRVCDQSLLHVDVKRFEFLE